MVDTNTPNIDEQLYTIVHGLTHGDIDFTPGLAKIKALIATAVNEARVDEINKAKDSGIMPFHGYWKDRIATLKGKS